MDNSIRFTCGSCGKKLRANQSAAGKKAKCACGQLVRIPALIGVTGATEWAPRVLWPWFAGGAAVLALALVLTCGLGYRLMSGRTANSGATPVVAAVDSAARDKDQPSLKDQDPPAKKNPVDLPRATPPKPPSRRSSPHPPEEGFTARQG
jgi:hypothetical protein